MSSSTKTTKTTATEPVVEVLDSFEDRLVTVEGISYSADWRGVLSKVIFGEVIGAMYSALDLDLDPVADDAPASAKTGRKDIIRNRIMQYIATKTGRYYSWSNLDAWRKAGVTNATLPEAVRVTMVEDESGDPDKAVLSGVFGVWPLQHLAKIEDEDVRASLAERLAAEDITSADAVLAEVNKENGLNPEPKDPVAASAMIAALVKSFRKNEAGLVGQVDHVMLSMDEDDAALLAKFGKVLWTKVRSDSAEPDKDKRNRKREEVFAGAVAQILFAGEAAEDDGAEDGAEPVL